MIHIQLPENLTTEIDSTQIQKAAQLAIMSQRQDEVDMTIVFTTDQQIRSLNASYRGYDEPTDVLSFSDDQIDPDTNRVYIGDVIISIETAAAQAGKYGHALLDEIQLLVVHGILHLLGFDHLLEADKAAMWAEQAKVLARLGLENIHIPDDNPHE